MRELKHVTLSKLWKCASTFDARVRPFFRQDAEVSFGDQVVELSVQLAVQEMEGKEEDREGQVEVEEEKRLKEIRSWMTMNVDEM